MYDNKFFKYAPFILPVIWVVIIATNVWYHGPKAWIFVALGMLVMIGIFTRLLIDESRHHVEAKETIKKLEKEKGELESQHVHELRNVWQKHNALLDDLVIAERSLTELIVHITKPYPRRLRYEQGIGGAMIPILYALLPTVEGDKQIRWALRSDISISVAGEGDRLFFSVEPDVLVTGDETLAVVRGHVAWLARADANVSAECAALDRVQPAQSGQNQSCGEATSALTQPTC